MVTPGDRREPPADTKCLPAAQRKQANSACSKRNRNNRNSIEPVKPEDLS